MFPADLHNEGMEHAAIIREMMRVTGSKQDEIARKLRVTQPTVSRWLKGKKPIFDHHQRIAAEANRLGLIPDDSSAASSTAAPDLAPLARAGDRIVRVVGYVGAGDKAHFYEVNQGDLDPVPAPDGATPKTVGVEIKGTSLGEFFDRAIAFYDDVRRPVTADLVGRLCIVGLEDGRVLIKKLRNGKKPGLFNLISQTEDPIRDVAIEWAARVIDVRPR